MDERQDNWDRIINISDDYDYNPDLAKSAIKKIKQKELAHKKRPMYIKWSSIAASLVIIIGVAVFMPIYLSSIKKPDELLYYTEDEMDLNYIEDINEFQKENQIIFNFFADDMTTSQYASLKTSSQIAYINQDLLYLDENGFDTINLKIVVLSNAEFDFCREFEFLSESYIVQNIMLQYSIEQVEEVGEQYQYYVTFMNDNIHYYLKILSYEYSIDKITQYINLLNF